jgi:hypothetical protein
MEYTEPCLGGSKVAVIAAVSPPGVSLYDVNESMGMCSTLSCLLGPLKTI